MAMTAGDTEMTESRIQPNEYSSLREKEFKHILLIYKEGKPETGRDPSLGRQAGGW